MACLSCGTAVELGALCRACAQAVAPCDGLIPDHVRSTVTMTDADAWVVDGFGAAHAIAARSTIGRSQEGELVVLAGSVSREHAELKHTDGKWQLRDLGSRNGTFVDGVRCQGRVALPPRAVIKVGDVALWFLSEVVHEPLPAPSMATGSAGGGLVRFLLFPSDQLELCTIGSADLDAGGALLSRAAGQDGWVERPLPKTEFQLLRALCARAVEEADSPAAVRGCVSTRQLARDLPIVSTYANEENVRQVVRRLRGQLEELDVAGILAVAPGRGYYIACRVTAGASGPDRR
jgi:hypothetical protein